jgi:hypothetical protein
LPADRIFIDCSGSMVEHWAPPAIPVAAPKSGHYTPADDSEAGMIQLHAAFVEDADGTLSDIGELAQHGTMIGDSGMALSLLRILEKHKLVTKTGSPQIMFRIGEAATLGIGDSDDANKGICVSVESRREETQIFFAVSVVQGLRERRCELAMSPYQRKTIIMKLEVAGQDEASKGKSEPAKYVFVTPKVTTGRTASRSSLAK